MELTFSFHSISICCSEKKEVYILGRCILGINGLRNDKGEIYQDNLCLNLSQGP